LKVKGRDRRPQYGGYSRLKLCVAHPVIPRRAMVIRGAHRVHPSHLTRPSHPCQVPPDKKNRQGAWGEGSGAAGPRTQRMRATFQLSHNSTWPSKVDTLLLYGNYPARGVRVVEQINRRGW
jgi:hypothetical protein